MLQGLEQENAALEDENASLPAELAALEVKVKEELERVKMQQQGGINPHRSKESRSAEFHDSLKENAFPGAHHAQISSFPGAKLSG